MMIAL